jgi:hypothetical protein
VSTSQTDMKDIKYYHAQIDQLFVDHSPVLVEVCSSATPPGAASDWYLLEAAAAFWGIVANSKPGTEFFVLSVRHLTEVRSQFAGTKVD